MDVYEVGHTFPEFDFQLHDHNPGVSEKGLFWTMPIPKNSVGMHFGKGEAAFCLSDAQMPNMHDLLTALWGGGEEDGEGNPLSPVFPSTVSMDARWFDAGPKEQLRDPANQFDYRHMKTDAHINWRSIQRGVMFESDDSPQDVLFAAVGKEKNGDFF
jgi:hypothetical protein